MIQFTLPLTTKESVKNLLYPGTQLTSDNDYICLLEKLDGSLRDDGEVMIWILDKIHYKAENVLKKFMDSLGPSLNKKRGFVELCLSYSTKVMPYIDETIRHDRAWMTNMIGHFDDPDFVKYASDEIREDANYLITKARKRGSHAFKYVLNASENLFKDIGFVTAALTLRTEILNKLDEKMLAEYEVGKIVASRAPMQIHLLSDKLRANKEICDIAFKKNPHSQIYFIKSPNKAAPNEEPVALENSPKHTDKDNPIIRLMNAIDNNDIELAEKSIPSSFEPMHLSPWAYKALMRCVRQNRNEIASMILNKFSSNSCTHAQILFAAAIEKDNAHVMALLIDRGICITSRYYSWGPARNGYDSPIQLAIERRSLAACQLLCSKGIDLTNFDIHGEPLLHYAIQNQLLDIAEILLKASSQIINIQNNDDLTALDIAVETASLAAVKLLCNYKAKVYVRRDTRNTLVKAMRETSDEHRKIVTLLTDYSPLNILTFLRSNVDLYRTHTGIKTLLIETNFSSNDCRKIPEHIKTIHCTSQLSIEVIQILQARGIKLIYDNIELRIDPKYLGGQLPTLACSDLVTTSENKTKGVFEHDLKTIMALSCLENLSPNPPRFGNICYIQPTSNEAYQFINASKKRRLSSLDKIFTVFAYRQKKAYLPDVTNNDCRCIVVLTNSEYNNLQISKDSNLHNFYDFLILSPRLKLDRETSVQIAKLTERRRAILAFAKEKKLAKLVFMDDNISQIAVNAVGEHKTPTELVYDYLLQEMRNSKEPLVSISTYSSLHKLIKRNQVGCKVWLINVARISEMLQGNLYEALMPYNETLWGEDYYLQVLLNTLFGNSEGLQGYKIIDPESCQLIRSNQVRSTNARQGMRVQEYSQEDVLPALIRRELEQSTPQLYEQIEKARLVFNQLISREVDRYKRHEKKCHTLDWDTLRQRSSSTQHQPLYLVNRSTVSSASYETTQNILTRIITELSPTIQQAVILLENKLYYVNRTTNSQLLIPDSSHSQKLKATISKLSSDKQAEPSDVALVKSPSIAVTRQGDFIPDLHAILRTFTHSNEDRIKVISEGMEVSYRPYQTEALKWLAQCLEETPKRNLTFNMATGTGKTLLMLSIALSAFCAAPEKNVVLLFPNIQLVHQTLKQVFNQFKPLLDYFDVPQTSMYGVCSKESKELKKGDIIARDQVQHYKKLHGQKGHIYLFCSDSFKKFNDIDDINRKEAFMANISTVILDESHQQDTLIHSDVLAPLAQSGQVLQCQFSATPKPQLEESLLNGEFSYQRTRAIEDGYLAPLLVDKTLSSTMTNEDIIELLLNQEHPNGGPLTNHKGIIYVESRDKAAVLVNDLKESKQFTDDFIHAFFSSDPNKGFYPGYTKFDEAISTFVKKDVGVAIVVKMLVEGFDDKKIDFIINTRKNVSASAYHQAIGRTIRLNDRKPNKIGFAVLREDDADNHAEETTLFPSNYSENFIRPIKTVAETISNQGVATIEPSDPLLGFLDREFFSIQSDTEQAKRSLSNVDVALDPDENDEHKHSQNKRCRLSSTDEPNKKRESDTPLASSIPKRQRTDSSTSTYSIDDFSFLMFLNSDDLSPPEPKEDEALNPFSTKALNFDHRA